MDELCNEIQNMIAQLTAVATAMQAAAPAIPGAPAAVPFALMPAQINPDDIIDYSSSSGKKLWKSATEPLEDRFDAEAKDVNLFIKQVAKQAKTAGWNAGTGNIITIPDANGNNHDLVKNYGQLTVEEICAHVTG